MLLCDEERIVVAEAAEPSASSPEEEPSSFLAVVLILSTVSVTLEVVGGAGGAKSQWLCLMRKFRLATGIWQ